MGKRSSGNYRSFSVNHWQTCSRYAWEARFGDGTPTPTPRWPILIARLDPLVVVKSLENHVVQGCISLEKHRIQLKAALHMEHSRRASVQLKRSLAILQSMCKDCRQACRKCRIRQSAETSMT